MRATMALLVITLMAQLATQDAVAQTTPDQTPPPTSTPQSAPTPAPEATPAPTAASVPTQPPPGGPKARDFLGLDVFGADGQRIGKVVKAAELADGKAGDLEIRSPGFFGFFSNLYVVPADKAILKSGHVDLSVTSDQAKQWTK